MKPVTFVLGVLVIASLAGAVQGQAPSGPLPPSQGRVSVGWDDTGASVAYLRYVPATVVIHEGETVTWVASSNTPHTVTSVPFGGAGGFDSSPGFNLGPQDAAMLFGPGGFLTPGQSFNHTFDQPGTWQYFCKIHPGMVATVTVTNATQATPQNPLPVGPTTSNASNPETVYATVGWGSGETSVDRFAPQDLRITAGTTVVWTNMHSSEPHTVTGVGPNGQIAFDSSPNIQGEPPGFEGPTGVLHMGGNNTQFAHTFATAGTWAYVCKLHPAMWGTVIVLPKMAAMESNNTGSNGGMGTNGGTTGATKDSGSRVPGFEVPMLLGALVVVGVALRRR